MPTWILTGSPENFEATRARDFRVIGMKERRRSFAEHARTGIPITLISMAFALFWLAYWGWLPLLPGGD